MELPTYGPGTLAFLDTMENGLVPCKVLAVTVEPYYGFISVSFQVTRTVGAWKRGRLDSLSDRQVVPRKAVKRPGRGQYWPRILPYRWLP